MSAIMNHLRRVYAGHRTAGTRKLIVNSNHSVLKLDPSIPDFRKHGWLVDEKHFK
jgi:hypothetical protein